ncbi:alpha/beta hydrolase [Streptomyces albidoflavus]|nr:alpha/beta hydrolase [Streptomyces albidoflavus]
MRPPPVPQFLRLRDRRFSYLDFGGPGPTLLALHGHFGRGNGYAPLAAALAGRYRVLAPDLRGHGLSENGGTFTPEEYVADTAALLHALDLTPAAVLGHSMGGALAFLLAARHPERVPALVVADMTVKNQPPETQPVLDLTDWPRRAPSREALRQAVEARGIPDASPFLDSAHPFPDGWGFLFDQADLTASQSALTGDFSAAWLRSAGPPALLLRAEHSFLLTRDTARWMAGARPGTELRELPACGHWLHTDDPDGFAAAVAGFLDGRRTGPGPGPAQ